MGSEKEKLCGASGVNAKLVLPDGAREIRHEGRRLTDGTPYYRLNSVALSVAWLENELGASVDALQLGETPE